MNVDLKRIRSIIAVAEHGNFRRAADALGISQPALSAHISEAERSIGVSLFSRTTRAVRLTSAGDGFVWRARRIVDELDAALLDLRDQATIARGRLSIACIPTVASGVLPLALRLFLKRFPAVSIQIFDDLSSAIEHLVETGAVDFGIGPAPSGLGALDFAPLLRDNYVAIVPKQHALAGRSSIGLRELLDFPILMLRPGSTIRAAIERNYPSIGRTFRPALELRNQYTAVAMVREGHGIGILPGTIKQTLGDRTQLAFVDITHPVIQREVGFLFRRGENFQPAARAFQEIFRRTMKSRFRGAA